MPNARTLSSSAIDRLVASSTARQVSAAVQPLRDKVTSIGAQMAASTARQAASAREQVLGSAVQTGRIAAAERHVWAGRYDKAPEVTAEILAEIRPGTAGPGELDAEAEAAYLAMFPATAAR